MPYIGAGTQRFNTADGLTVSGNASVSGTTALTGNATAAGTLDVTGAATLTAGFTASDGCTITTADNSAQLTLVSTDADANAGPILTLNRDSSSPANGDVLGEISFNGDDDAGNGTEYVRIQSRANNVANGSEAGQLFIYNQVAGTLRHAISIYPSEVVINEDSIDLDFRVESNGNANMLVVDAGNDRVGIGTGTPQFGLSLSQGTSDSSRLGWHDSSNNKRASIICSSASDSLSFHTGTSDTERMRIDSGGNVLVNQSSTTSPGLSNTTTGLAFSDSGRVFSSASGTFSSFNRNSSAGSIVVFRKDGTIVSAIGVDNNGDGVIDGGSSRAGIRFVSDALSPRQDGSESDNVVDLGKSDVRFDDVFATNGTIQTSDQNEKQDIASLTTAEMTAAKAISKLFKTFKWKDKVAAKGDAARTHTGVIAQEVQTAMTDAGLDASKYAFWCSDTWWEISTEVAAVEAVAEAAAVYDDDGNLVTPPVDAVPAKDAYTRIDTYNTADEAPEGATQRTRLGIRYPELLAFVGAATEQRLADIETRLTALEAGE